MPRRLRVRHYGGALAIIGASGAAKTAANASLCPAGGASFTFAWWGKWLGTGTGTRVVAQYDDAAYASGWLVSYRSDGGLLVYVKSAAALLTVPYASVFVDAAWHRYVVSCDSAAQTITIYRDGVQIGQVGSVPSWGGMTAAGALCVGTSSQFGNAATGTVADAIYDVGHAWSASQVASDYFDGAPPDTYTHRWPLDDGAGTSARALRGGLALTISGSAVVSADSPMIGRGVVRNLVPHGADIAQASVWAPTAMTVPGTTTLVGGVSCNDLNDGNAVATNHLVQNGAVATLVLGRSYVVSGFVAAGSRTWFAVTTNNVKSVQYFQASGDGTVGSAAGSQAGAIRNAGIAAVSGGYRWWYTFTCVDTAGVNGHVAVYAASANGTTAYTGTNAIAISAGGVMIEEAAPGQTTPSPVVSTGAAPLSAYGKREMRQNIAKQSASPSNAAWSKLRATVSGTVITSTSATLSAQVYQVFGSVPLTYHTLYARVRKGNSFTLASTDGGSNGASATFDGTTGVLAGTSIAGTTWGVSLSYCATAKDDPTCWDVYVSISHPVTSSATCDVTFVPNKNKVTAWNWANSSGVGDTIEVTRLAVAFVDGPFDYIATTAAPANANGAPRRAA